MLTYSVEALISEQNPSITLKGVPEGLYDVLVVLQPIDNKPDKPNKRKAGFSKATFWMSEDFNEPLEDFKDYM